MKVATCTIGRMENSYVQEFVDHYKSLGVDKMFIYDNNYGEEEHFEDVIMKDISDGFVEIVDFRDKSICQLTAYQDCYDRHNSEYDWFIYCDVDEFLTLKDFGNIKDFLSQDKFDGFDMIHVNWKIYDDNDQVVRTEGGVKERFTRVKEPLDFKKTYNFPENNHIKPIVRGGLKNVRWNATTHTPNGIEKCCDADGKECNPSSPFNSYSYNSAWFNHYFTKSLEEWTTIKTKRGYADGNKDIYKKVDIFDEFFKVNDVTPQKLQYINGIKTDIFICTHKDFQAQVKNQIYKIVDSRNINNNMYNGLDGSFYSEIMQMLYINDTYPLKKYVGFCHYRRYFSFMDDIPYMDDIFKEHDAIAAHPLTFSITVREQYRKCHNVEDLDIVGDIINDHFPQYSTAYTSFINGKIMFPCNMFIMRVADFKEYCEFISSVLKKYIEKVGTDIYGRIEQNRDKYIKDFYPNNEPWYQYRIGGFLAERLTNVFIVRKFKEMKVYKIKETETKYK